MHTSNTNTFSSWTRDRTRGLQGKGEAWRGAWFGGESHQCGVKRDGTQVLRHLHAQDILALFRIHDLFELLRSQRLVRWALGAPDPLDEAQVLVALVARG
jgi:hypothetical protein